MNPEEHPTSNTERRNEQGFALPFDVRCSMFDVRCWMFDVGCSMFSLGSGVSTREFSFRGNLSPLVPHRERERGFRDGGGIQMCPAFWGMACHKAMPRLRDD